MTYIGQRAQPGRSLLSEVFLSNSETHMSGARDKHIEEQRCNFFSRPFTASIRGLVDSGTVFWQRDVLD